MPYCTAGFRTEWGAEGGLRADDAHHSRAAGGALERCPTQKLYPGNRGEVGLAATLGTADKMCHVASSLSE